MFRGIMPPVRMGGSVFGCGAHIEPLGGRDTDLWLTVSRRLYKQLAYKTLRKKG